MQPRSPDAALRLAARTSEVEHLVARLRSGALSLEALRLAARLGYPAACAALAEAPARASGARELAEEVAALERRGAVRVALALAEAAGVEQAVEPYEREVVARLLGAARAWLERPSASSARALADLDADFLTWFEGGYWLAAVADCVARPALSDTLAHLLATADRNLGARALQALEALAPALLEGPGS